MWAPKIKPINNDSYFNKECKLKGRRIYKCKYKGWNLDINN